MNFDDGDLSDEMFGSFKHHASYTTLASFFEASGTCEVQVPFVMVPTPTDEKLSVSQVLKIFDAMRVAKDVGLLAAFLHTKFMVPLFEKKTIEAKKLFFGISSALAMMMRKLAFMEKIVECSEIIEVEKSGLQLTTCLMAWRSWRASLALLAGRIQEALLLEFCAHLDIATKTLKASVPSWEAAFENEGEVNMELATKLLVGKAAQKIASLHNAVHGVLVNMMHAATKLEVSPRLQDNDITKGHIAVARSCLARAKLTSTITDAVLILSGELSSSSVGDAKSFLEKHSEMLKSFPILLVKELQHLQDGNAVMASPHSKWSCASDASLSVSKRTWAERSAGATISPAAKKPTSSNADDDAASVGGASTAAPSTSPQGEAASLKRVLKRIKK